MAVIQQTPVGRSDSFHALMDRVSDAAVLDRTVLVVGERGTGKELIASRLHFLSPRWEQVFVPVNCAAYTDAQLDILLFGESFNDGRNDVDGQFVRADGGTLFLNDIDTVSVRLQEKMLQVFEQGVVDPVGNPDTTPVNVRVIAAARGDLRRAVSENRFAQDLLDHLTFDVIPLPPLRDRPDDILALADHFGKKMAATLGADSFAGFTMDALGLLARQPWPGNVRGLRSVVERSVGQAFLSDETLSRPIERLILDPFEGAASLGAAPVSSDSPQEDMPIDETLDFNSRVMTFERGLIDKAMNAHSHHQGKAADALGLSYHAFRGLLRKHGLKK